MNINDVEMNLTAISIIVTLISIVCSLASFHFAKNAKRYKEETANYLKTLDIKNLLGKFDAISSSFFLQTRSSEWYKGIDPNVIISPMLSILQTFSEVYPQITQPEALKDKVHKLDSYLQDYDKATQEKKKLARSLTMDILDLLNQVVVEKSKHLLKS